MFTFVSLLSNINTSNKSIGVLVNSNNTKLNGVLVNRHTTLDNNVDEMCPIY